VAGAESYTWHMVLAPAATPAPAVQAANAAFNRAPALPHVQARLADLAIQVRVDSTPASAANWLREEVAKRGAVVRDAGIRAE
jgi:tripartite-type tricarboxylate transporter receptor subunit TctC